MRRIYTAVLLVYACSWAIGCGYGQGACTAIDLADKACEYVVVEYLDPDTGELVRQRVPREEMRALAISARDRESTE